jgi:ribosomal protein S18 acetylase RimI-like enzyme
MEHIEIKKAGADDVHKLQEIGIATFYETFSPFNTEENMKEYLRDSFADEKLKKELRDDNSGFYFAYDGNTLIGYLKVNWGSSQTEIKDKNALEIERIYVLNEYQGRRVGQHLYEKAIEIAGERGVDYVWLGVWERNHKALRFYMKNGFREFDRHVFRLGKESQTDLMMKLELVKQ